MADDKLVASTGLLPGIYALGKEQEEGLVGLTRGGGARSNNTQWEDYRWWNRFRLMLKIALGMLMAFAWWLRIDAILTLGHTMTTVVFMFGPDISATLAIIFIALAPNPAEYERQLMSLDEKKPYSGTERRRWLERRQLCAENSFVIGFIWLAFSILVGLSFVWRISHHLNGVSESSRIWAETASLIELFLFFIVGVSVRFTVRDSPP